MSKRYEHSYETMCNIYSIIHASYYPHTLVTRPDILLSSYASFVQSDISFPLPPSSSRFSALLISRRGKEIRWMDGLDGRMGFPEMDSKEDCLLGKGGRFSQRIDYRHSILPGPIRGFWVQKRRKAWSWEKREEVCGRTMPKFGKKC